MRAPFVLFTAACASASPVDIVSQSNLVWTDATWKNDGTGSMPIGNGDVAGNVWVDDSTGELVLLMGKSDIFDQNGQPVHVGLVRVAFDPPLWSSFSPVTPGNGTNVQAYTKAEKTIVKQNTLFAAPTGWRCKSQELCPEQSAELCDQLGAACGGFSLSADWNEGLVPELSTTGEPEQRSGTETWTLYSKPASPTPAPTWSQTLNLGEASIDIKSEDLAVRVFVDTGAPVLRVQAKSLTGKQFSIKGTVEPYRADQKTQLGRNFCHDRFDSHDVVVPSGSKPASLGAAAVWYHHNPDNASYFSDTMKDQGVDPNAAGLHDPFSGLTFGAALFGDGLTADSEQSVSGEDLTEATLNLGLVTKQMDETAWMSEMEKLVASTSQPDAEAHAEAWQKLWERSYLNITGSSGASATDKVAAKQIMDHAHWQRFLELAQGTQASAPIKYNGQAFTVNDSGKGWDYRDWGASYWWQNTRQPYYNSLAQGDVDVLRSMLDFYHRMLPYVQARTLAQFNGTETPMTGEAALYPETTTQFGCYDPGDWGCKSEGHREHGASANEYIRFHYTGGLELCLLFLDDLTVTQDSKYFAEKGLPVCTAVVEGFRQRFPKTSSGKTDMFPTQALETYQCPDPTSRDDCVTAPSTDIAGLQAVLSRLLALETGVSDDVRKRWAQQLQLLPDMPIADGKILPAAAGAKSRHNSENTELYSVHPFRIYGVGKADLDIAKATYAARPSPCNLGWCQDIIDAAMLGITDDATKMVSQRAAEGAADGFRFPGFAKHYQDYEPSLDHYAFMRTALNYMLMSPLDDDKQSILLFPSWPTDKWDVSFKLTGPLNTVVEAACVGGVLTHLQVTPASRKADVQVMSCKPALGDVSIVV